ncbi:trimethylamine-corrinoid protein Co-methyltransferase [Acididesulfobacillus acetoxydans]|uniref:Trimethylamine methyltransferase MttB n=1 Tax=Acididesulfobacillus acetoxydans TaxID=1561005 RepID=A0A8S0Y2C3_9FIRM|nr:trimethylamine methyltransferase family protein [Acididesulfobacillus acetoxydans]CAA7600615.1 trimethylamine-corrinoid protein Co-methyltransferase [Acididesulfobacillus acetoxydans]CEJ09396.1 Trimethylamine methyltransferase MttB [Acididesulfobacillus acetoxydans]
MPAKSNYVANATPLFSILSPAQCEEIFLAAEEVLERTGVTVHDEEARDILKKAGCWLDGIRVRIPSAVVNQALNSVPKRVTLCNSRTGSRDVLLEGNNAYFGTGSDTPFTIDPYTGRRRRSTKQSVGWACKVIDALPNLDFVMSLGIVQDVPLLISDRHQFEAQVLNTSKPIVTTAHDIYGFADIIEMCEIIAGGEEELRRNPFMTLYAEPISPLQHAWEAASKLVLAARKGLPVVYTPCVMAGGTVPATMAGVLTNGLAESLSGLVINQATREGSPFIMGGVFTIMDMSSTIFSYGSPEFNLLMSALADMAHYLKLPMFGTAGCSDACVVDEQAGIEAALSIAMTALSGPNLNHDVGYIEYGSTSSLEYLTINNDVIGMARRLVRGIKVNDETLALDLIDKVGPGGHFLAEDHTMKYFKTETYYPELINRQRYDAWKENGSKTLFQRANEKVKDIIENYQPEPLPQDVQKRIRAIVERAEQKVH